MALLAAATARAQTARSGRLMRDKLAHSQRMLEAVTTSDWTQLDQQVRALTAIAKSPTWSELMTPGLRPYSGAFERALADLATAAQRRDYDAAAAGYTALTASCFGCHKHVMRARIAGERTTTR